MPAIAITGTIGSGKSIVLRELGALLAAETFCADEVNRQLLDEDWEVKNLILLNLGKECYQDDGKANRKALFSLIKNDAIARGILEGILHPRIEALWKPLAEKFRKSDSYFLAEIPLLFEKHLEVFFDKTIVVGSSDSVRTERLKRSRSMNSAECTAWMKMQAPQDAKITKAHYLLWNDGSKSLLLQQTLLLQSHFLHR